MFWDQLTSPQIEKLDKKIPVIFPIAATEQHGSHLPLATDRMINEYFCESLNKKIGKKVLILPIISVGCSEHHLDFAGSLSVQHSTFLQQLIDIAECVVKHGFKNILVLNSHGGNQNIGGSFLEIFGYRHPKCNLVLATWWRIALEALKPLNESGIGGTGHAGEFETSLMLLIVPTFKWAEGDMINGGQAAYYRRMKEMTPTGVFGDTTYASVKKGKQITKHVVKALKNIVLDLNKQDH